MFCRFVGLLIILSSCQALCAIYGPRHCVSWRAMTWPYETWRPLKETDNKRALCISFPPRYYGAQWSITCRDVAVHSCLTRGHNMKEVPPGLSSKTNFPRLYLRFSEGHCDLLVIVWSNWLLSWRKSDVIRAGLAIQKAKNGLI